MYKTSTNNPRLNHAIIKRLEQSLMTIHAIYPECLIEVSLFGSYAKGTSHRFSSIDLLVVVECSDERFVQRNANLQRLLNESDEMPMIDPLVYTQEELLDLIKKKESFIDSLLKEAVVLWNGFNDINLHELQGNNIIPSRYLSSSPNLDEVVR